MMWRIEAERERMLKKGHEQLIKPLENFRKVHIGQAKEGKKAFDKQTQKFCASLERYLNLKAKVPDNQLQEADAQLEMEKRGFYEQSMKYVLQLQEVQERKKFEFVEILLAFIQSFLTFYHEGYETNEDSKEYISELQQTLQKTRKNFETTKEQAERLMFKMLEARKVKPFDQLGTLKGKYSRQGYLYLMEKKALATSWTKYWCCYNKEDKKFYMVPFHQPTGKLTSAGETITLLSCIRRASDSIDRRFCMDLTVIEKPGLTLTFQALSDEDRKLWMDVMGGKEPVYTKPNASTENSSLDDVGFTFINKCISAIEANGLDDQGLYRVVGVNSKVNKLLQLGLDRKKVEKLDLNDSSQFEIRTITSAVKQYLRTLPESLMTFKLHPEFIDAAKQESLSLRLMDIHTLVHKLPPCNFQMLYLLIAHLRRVANNADKNLMTIANLGVCFGPTLMRPEEETVAAIMDIKFCNIVIEILVEHYDMMFKQTPEDPELRKNINKVVEQNQPIKRMKCLVPPPPVNQINKTPQETHMVTNVEQKAARHYANVAPMLPMTHQQQPQHRGKAWSVPNSIYENCEQPSNKITSGNPESLTSPQSNQIDLCDPLERPSSSKVMETNSSYTSITELAKNMMLFTVDSPTLSTSMHSSPANQRVPGHMTGSLSGSLGNNINATLTNTRTVRTLFHCEGENTTELSFEPNMIICNVRNSKEPGWLEGCLDGKTGLIPENYVVFID